MKIQVSLNSRLKDKYDKDKEEEELDFDDHY